MGSRSSDINDNQPTAQNSTTGNDLKAQISCVQALNHDTELSTLWVGQIVFNERFDSDSYIVSTENPLMILIRFHNPIQLTSVQLYVFDVPLKTNRSLSKPVQLDIYTVEDSNTNYADIKSITPEFTFKCVSNEMQTGQLLQIPCSISHQASTHFAISINSIQTDTNRTYINGIKFRGVVLNNLNDTPLSDKDFKLNQWFDEQNNYQAISAIPELKADIFDSTSLIPMTQTLTPCSLCTCRNIERMVHIMDTYHLKEAFEDMNNQISLLNDFHHALQFHPQHFEEIYRMLCSTFDQR
eukprot:92700_1